MGNTSYTETQIATGAWVRALAAGSPRGWNQFYHTGQWLRKRDYILTRDHNQCQCCRKRGKYSRANHVHHLKHLRQYPELALTDDNLISVCGWCHENVYHPEKHKKKNKDVTVERW